MFSCVLLNILYHGNTNSLNNELSRHTVDVRGIITSKSEARINMKSINDTRLMTVILKYAGNIIHKDNPKVAIVRMSR